jgi:membrane protease YdiL (CAAX protease family)
MKNPLVGTNSFFTNMTPAFRVLMGISIFVFSLAFMSIAGYIIASAVTGISMSEMSKMDYKVSGERLTGALKIMSLFSDIGIFAIPALLLPWLLFGKNVSLFMGFQKKSPLILFVFAICLALCVQPMVDLTARINQHLVFPHFMGGFEQSIKDMQSKTEEMMKHFVTMPDLPSFLVNILFVAVMPALFEELFFRGLVQRSLQGWLKKDHLAVFVSAFIFSAFHREFYSFLPLFLLGLLLGYAYLWSGDLKLSILIHFTNNLMALVQSYTLQLNGKPAMPQNTGDHSPVWLYMVSAVLMVFLLYLYKIKAQANNVLAHESDQTEPQQ